MVVSLLRTRVGSETALGKGFKLERCVRVLPDTASLAKSLLLRCPLPKLRQPHGVGIARMDLGVGGSPRAGS